MTPDLLQGLLLRAIARRVAQAKRFLPLAGATMISTTRSGVALWVRHSTWSQ